MSERKSKRDKKHHRHRDYSPRSRSRSNSKSVPSSSASHSPERKPSKSSRSRDQEHKSSQHQRSSWSKSKGSAQKSFTSTPLKSQTKDQNPPENSQETPKTSGSHPGNNGFPLSNSAFPTHPMFNPMFSFQYSSAMMGTPFESYFQGGFHNKGPKFGAKTQEDSENQKAGSLPKTEMEIEKTQNVNQKSESNNQEAPNIENPNANQSQPFGRRGSYYGGGYGRQSNGFYGRGSHYGQHFYKMGGSRHYGNGSRGFGGMSQQEYYQQMLVAMTSNPFGVNMMNAAFSMEEYQKILLKNSKENEGKTQGPGNDKEESKNGKEETKEPGAVENVEGIAQETEEQRRKNRILEKIGWIEALPHDLLENRDLIPLIGGKALEGLYGCAEGLEELRKEQSKKTQKSLRSIEKRLRVSLHKNERGNNEQGLLAFESKAPAHLAQEKQLPNSEFKGFWSLQSFESIQTNKVGTTLRNPEEPSKVEPEQENGLNMLNQNRKMRETSNGFDFEQIRGREELGETMRRAQLLIQKVKLL